MYKLNDMTDKERIVLLEHFSEEQAKLIKALEEDNANLILSMDFYKRALAISEELNEKLKTKLETHTGDI